MKLFIKAFTLAFIFTTFTLFANAQTTNKKALNLEGAKRVISAAMDYAKKNNAPGGVIAVVDDGGNLIALERIDGTFTAGANISIGKAKTAVMFKRPTKFFEDVIKNGRTAMVALPDFTPLQGGVPIMLDGQLIGGVGVSGAASAQQDEEIANAGANVFDISLKTSITNNTPVNFFDSNAVEAAFAKGAVLLDGNGRDYMVHASRRDKPGIAEIHTLDTDIIYVLAGTATFVTGGTAIETKEIAANEIRGTKIEGGETRKLVKGDVIVVPNGVPHWFKEVDGTFLYYVVKAR